MIPRTVPSVQVKSWQDELQQLITEPKELFDLLQLNAAAQKALLKGAQLGDQLFSLRTTHAFANRIQKGCIDDPLLKQILPVFAEGESPAEYSSDPLEEALANPVKGIVHKYHGRVLLIAAPQCAINCRYCFRRHFDYQGNSPSRQEWAEALLYIENDNTLDEVILSGGDPLVISDRTLSWLITQLEQIPHVKRLRFHSRIPIVLPSRITPSLVSLLAESRFEVVMVIHCNHPQEIDEHVAEALQQLKDAGITLLNQSVLLAGVNDSTDTLVALSKTLFTHGVMPYYLHKLDKVSGASHFDIPEDTAKNLYKTLLSALPGYLVPKFTQEIPGEPSKTQII